MTTDLQADLDAIADELFDVVSDEDLVNDVIYDVATRLRHLLDDRNLTEHVPLMRAADVNRIFQDDGAWQVAVALNTDYGAEWLPLNTVCAPASENPFLPDWPNLLVVAHEWASTMPPVPTADPVEPATERVRLDLALGRDTMRNGHRRRIVGVDTSAGRFKLAGSTDWLRAAPDGTVEVLKGGPVTNRGTRTMRLDADPETTAMVLHAAARGACRTSRGTVVTLLAWPLDGDRATVRVHRENLAWPTADLDPVCCEECHGPAHPDIVRRGLDLCAGCAEAT